MRIESSCLPTPEGGPDCRNLAVSWNTANIPPYSPRCAAVNRGNATGDRRAHAQHSDHRRGGGLPAPSAPACVEDRHRNAGEIKAA